MTDANQQKKEADQENEMLIDTSGMSEGKAEALHVTEAARQAEWTQPSFAQKLFLGEFRRELLDPFPEQNEEDKKIGDEFIDSLSTYLKENLDADEVDATRTIPETVMTELKKRGIFAMAYLHRFSSFYYDTGKKGDA